MKKAVKRNIKAFTFTLTLSMLTFGLFYGLAVVYVNTSNAINKEKIEIIKLQQTSYDKAELEVVGRVYNIKLKDPTGIPSLLYTIIPPEFELALTALDSIAEQIEKGITQ